MARACSNAAARLRSHDTSRGARQRFAIISARLRIFTHQTQSLSVGPRRVVETAQTHIDRRDNLEAAAVIRIGDEVSFDFGQGGVQTASLHGISRARAERLVRQIWAAEPRVNAERYGGNDEENNNNRRAPPQERALVAPPAGDFGRIARSDEPACSLRPSAGRLARRQLPPFDVSVDLGELRLVKGDGARLALRI